MNPQQAMEFGLIDKVLEHPPKPNSQAEEIINLKTQLNHIYVKHTGQDLETIHNSLERDKFMNPQQAMEFGLIDKVLEHPPKAGAEADKKRMTCSQKFPSAPGGFF